MSRVTAEAICRVEIGLKALGDQLSCRRVVDDVPSGNLFVASSRSAALIWACTSWSNRFDLIANASSRMRSLSAGSVGSPFRWWCKMHLIRSRYSSS